MRFALCLFLSAAFVAAQSDPPVRVGRLNYASGPVSFQPAGETDWVEAPLNRPLVAGDSLWTGANARAELHIGSTALRLGANTAFQLLDAGDEAVQIRLSEGTLSVHVREFSGRELFEIDTPNLAFTVAAEGEYRVDADPDSQTTTVSIRDGRGEVNGGGQSFPLATRQRAVVVGEQQVSYQLRSVPVMDEWDQWGAGRDRREEQSRSAQYVSREVPGYEDLDQYGGWSVQAGYGNVWMPNSVGAGWAPYQDGQWVWISPWGWTWVDAAPWGFAPYHYGRWASFGNRWGWIPGPRGGRPAYAPALVGWIGGGGFSASVGWFALGPREPYFPSYQVSQGYFRRVNGSNTVFNNAAMDGYYRNSRGPGNGAMNSISYMNRGVRNGVIAVPSAGFGTGRGVGREMGPGQLNGTQVFANPNVAPRRESVYGGRGPARGGAPPAGAFQRQVVVRTAPPAGVVPFSRQQEALERNGGRPLAPAAVQQMRGEGVAVAPRVRVIEGNGRGGGSALPPQEQRGNGRGQQERVQPQALPPQAQQPRPQEQTQPQMRQPRENARPQQQERGQPRAVPPQVRQPQEQRGNGRGQQERVQPQVQQQERGQERARPERPVKEDKPDRKQN